MYAAALVAGIAIDILRVHLGEDALELAGKRLGGLLNRLKSHAALGAKIPGLENFISLLDQTLTTRNDLIHAMATLHGLHRRTKDDPSRVVNFYTIAELQQATADFEQTRRAGTEVLYFDGGAAVRKWTSQPQSPSDSSEAKS